MQVTDGESLNNPVGCRVDLRVKHHHLGAKKTRGCQDECAEIAPPGHSVHRQRQVPAHQTL